MQHIVLNSVDQQHFH